MLKTCATLIFPVFAKFVVAVVVEVEAVVAMVGVVVSKAIETGMI